MPNPLAPLMDVASRPEPQRGPGRDNNGSNGGDDFAAMVDTESRRDTHSARDGSGTHEARREGGAAARSGGNDAGRRGDEGRTNTSGSDSTDRSGQSARNGGGQSADDAGDASRNTAGRGNESNAGENQSAQRGQAAANAGARGETRQAATEAARALQAEAGQAARPGQATETAQNAPQPQVTRAATAAQRAAAAAQQGNGTGSDATQQASNAGRANGQQGGARIAGQQINVTVTEAQQAAARPTAPVSGATAFAVTSAARNAADGQTGVSGRTADRDPSGRAAPRGDQGADRQAAANLRQEASAQAAQAARQARAEVAARGAVDQAPVGQQQPQPSSGDAARFAQQLAGADADPQPGADTTRGPAGQNAQANAANATARPMTAGMQAQGFDPVMQSMPGSGQAQASDPAAATRAADTPGQTAFQARSAPSQAVQDQVAVQIQRAAANGQQRLSMRLHPADLGRIDVKLDVRDDGSIRATLSVEKPDTLDMMQRDVRSLEKALNDAGLKTDDGSLNFNLQDQQGDGEPGDEDGTGFDGLRTADDETDADSAEELAAAPLISATGVNLRI